MAERCAGFIIIALGESIVVTGATFADLPWTTETVTAFVAAFIGALAMWWIYFHKGAEAGSEQISRSSEPGRLARLAYTYLHMPIVAGIILTAVADELVLTHPADHSDLKTVLSAIGGPLLFLIGTILFKHTFSRFLQLSHGVGIVALCILAWFASGLSPLMLSILTTAILVDGRGVGIDLAEIRRGRGAIRRLSRTPPRREPRTCRRHRSMIRAASSPSRAPALRSAPGCICSCSRCGCFRRRGMKNSGRAPARSAPSC